MLTVVNDMLTGRRKKIYELPQKNGCNHFINKNSTSIQDDMKQTAKYGICHTIATYYASDDITIGRFCQS